MSNAPDLVQVADHDWEVAPTPADHSATCRGAE
jgi:hypothetical protein